ncbi:hypothetical protein D3C81_2095900 [compost metagenome]
MLEQKLLDFTWRDVFSTTNHHVLDAACDADIAFFIHGGKVTAVNPAVGINCLGGLFRVIPIPLHK